mmetsp:Transcript_59414/g.181260  ORF Transcript_59414/g.181260 Transcript_59414/m.181260 type:complete len:205 (+) Transcript_59414:1537-2151(+)
MQPDVPALAVDLRGDRYRDLGPDRVRARRRPGVHAHRLLGARGRRCRLGLAGRRRPARPAPPAGAHQGRLRGRGGGARAAVRAAGVQLGRRARRVLHGADLGVGGHVGAVLLPAGTSSSDERARCLGNEHRPPIGQPGGGIDGHGDPPVAQSLRHRGLHGRPFDRHEPVFGGTDHRAGLRHHRGGEECEEHDIVARRRGQVLSF